MPRKQKQPAIKKIDVIVIMDRSGSMSTTWSDAVGGVNTLIEDQKKEAGEAAFTLVHFDTEYGIHLDRVPMGQVQPLTGEEFPPRGSTALLDAIGRTIGQHDARVEKADHTVLAIVTDGQENSSHEYNNEKIKTMITEHEKTGKFTVLFVGANIDAFDVGSSLGISAFNTTNYFASAVGTQAAYASASASIGNLRSVGQTVNMSQTYTKKLVDLDPNAVDPNAVDPNKAWDLQAKVKNVKVTTIVTSTK